MSAEERLLDEAAVYHRLAVRYGWTIDQVDNSSAILLGRMLIVAQVEDEVRADRDRRGGDG